MPVSELLNAGLQLMLIGMGSVFLFLALLVAVMKGMSKLAQKLEPVPAVLVTSPSEVCLPNQNQELIAAISVAISRYRAKRQ